MQTVIKEYIRNKANDPRGLVLAVRTEDGIRYGYSLLNTSVDRFNKEMGTKIALKRALAPQYKLPKVPDRENMVVSAFNKIEARALKYFKDIPTTKIKMEHSSVKSSYTEE